MCSTSVPQCVLYHALIFLILTLLPHHPSHITILFMSLLRNATPVPSALEAVTVRYATPRYAAPTFPRPHPHPFLEPWPRPGLRPALLRKFRILRQELSVDPVVSCLGFEYAYLRITTLPS